MKRKAQGISINTIIMIVIGLLVLVIIASVLMSRSGTFVQKLQSCQEVGGVCKPLVRGAADKGCGATIDGFGRYNSDQVCTTGTGSNKVVDDASVCCMPGASQ